MKQDLLQNPALFKGLHPELLSCKEASYDVSVGLDNAWAVRNTISSFLTHINHQTSTMASLRRIDCSTNGIPPWCLREITVLKSLAPHPHILSLISISRRDGADEECSPMAPRLELELRYECSGIFLSTILITRLDISWAFQVPRRVCIYRMLL